MRITTAHIAAISAIGLSMTGCAMKKNTFKSQGHLCAEQQQESWRYKLNVVEEDEEQITKDCFSISKAEIDDTIRQNADDIFDCLEQSIARCPGQKRISVSMVINKMGGVSKSAIVKGSHYDTDLMRCVAEKTANWAFPKPKYSEHYAFVYPFLME